MADIFKPSIKIGEQALQKGEVRDGKQLIAWDCVQDCVPDACPIGSKCLYAKKSASGRCALQVEYLQSFVDTILRTYRYMDEGDLFKLGMHLVPLYSQLCRQKIVEKSVGSVCYEDMKGVTRIHPIYKEMRETLKAITMMWTDMGFKGITTPGMPNATGEVGFIKGRAGFGDPNHYANITKGAEERITVVR